MFKDSTPMDEHDLVTKLREGDCRATEQFVRDNVSWMLAVARRLTRDEALAEDCVQESFFKAFRKIGGFDGRSALKSWMHRIVVNTALTKLRSARRRNCGSIEELLPEFDQNGCRVDAPWHDDEISTPAEILERKDLHKFVASRIEELPDSYRVIIVLKDIEELSTAEVARILELDEGNVRVRLHRARAALKKLLEPLYLRDEWH